MNVISLYCNSCAPYDNEEFMSEVVGPVESPKKGPLLARDGMDKNAANERHRVFFVSKRAKSKM